MNSNVDELKTSIQINRRNSLMQRQRELIVWLIFAFLVSGRVWLDVGSVPLDKLFEFRYFEILLSVLIFIFPVLYSLVFGYFPLEYVRKIREEKKALSTNYVEKKIENTETVKEGFATENIDELLTKEAVVEKPEEYLSNLAIGSRRLANNLYSRSGVYLIIGVLIAFSGLGFFYLQTTSIAEIKEPSNILIALAPNFGILFFIEFIALFFLKQYRSAMDEFRYYESIQRSREETFALVKMLNHSESPDEVFKMIEKTGFRSVAEKLEKGQTTELLESKKLNKDEAEIFGKILDIVGKR